VTTATHFNLKAARRRASHFRLYITIPKKTTNSATFFGFVMVEIFRRLVGIYHMTLTFEPLLLNT